MPTAYTILAVEYRCIDACGYQVVMPSTVQEIVHQHETLFYKMRPVKTVVLTAGAELTTKR